MHPNFSLENPETFNAVFPWTQVEPSRKEPGRKQSSSKLLQEKVYMYCVNILGSLFRVNFYVSYLCRFPTILCKFLISLYLKLSHYLDLVEVQIARQISLRSEAFFHAVTSHDKLQENMSSTITAIKNLR